MALGGGFAWYERRAPTRGSSRWWGRSRRFAALGRIAFAALPNVKPTTDIVLVAGYALGGAPGFAVGALAGLTSNFFFGQGPWTPWQMAAGPPPAARRAAWRCARARPRSPPLGRWPLAIVCCAAGFAFTAVQDVGDWVRSATTARPSSGLRGAGPRASTLVHAAGCLAFALALGPALARSIQRFARRTKVTWVPAEPRAGARCRRRRGAGGSRWRPGWRSRGDRPAAAAVRSPASVTAAAAYLLAAQNTDGGFGPAPGQRLGSALRGLGGARAGRRRAQPDRSSRGGRSLPRLRPRAAPAAATRVAGADDPRRARRRRVARAFGGRDLVGALQRASAGTARSPTRST